MQGEGQYYSNPLRMSVFLFFFFGFSLAYSYLWLRRRYFRSEEPKKNCFFFGFSLAYSYLWPTI
jgi:hypothetical protein